MKIIAIIFIILCSILANPVFSQRVEGNTVQVNIKKNKPVVIWLSPIVNDTTIVKLSSQLKAVVLCEDSITNLEIFVNGSSDNGVEFSKSKDKKLIIIDKLIPLQEGANMLYIVANTAMSTTTSVTKNILAKRPGDVPLITWLSPNEKTLSLEANTVNIKACVSSKIQVKSVDIYVNENLMRGFVKVGGNDVNCAVTVDKRISLQEGLNTIYMVAGNENGSSTSEIKTINVDRIDEKPVISWISPSILESTQETSNLKIKAIVRSPIALQSVNVFINGNLMTGYSEINNSDKGGIATVDKEIILVEGENNINIVASNKKGSVISQTLFVDYSNKILHQKRVALVIGNSNYKINGRLPNPKNDANDITNALRRLKFDVEQVSDADYSNLGKAIDNFGLKVKYADISFFYYAGHGVQANGTNYLIPVDAEIQDENQVKYRCIDANQVLSYMESGESKVNIIVMDACRDNPFERSWKRSVKGNGLASMDAPIGTLIAYSTQPGNTAADGTGKNGLYTSSLLEYLENPDLSLLEIFMKVRVKVLKESGKKQQPWESSSLTENVYLLK